MPFYGLSPLARGNPAWVVAVAAWVGPIPARAGEPAADVGQRMGDGAYPRSRGGTLALQCGQVGSQGLSPLARGNLSRFSVKSRM